MPEEMRKGLENTMLYSRLLSKSVGGYIDSGRRLTRCASSSSAAVRVRQRGIILAGLGARIKESVAF